MKVMVIVKASKASEAGEMPSTELLTAMGRFNEELAQAGILLEGAGLTPSSRGVRVRFSGNSRKVMNGPFTETKELIAGYWVWQVQSLQEAIDWVKKCPNPMNEDSDIEIRPFFEAADFGEAYTPELREQEAAVRAISLGLNRPEFKVLSSLTLVGLNASYTMETRVNIPEQWHTFVPRASSIPGMRNTTFYGVCWRTKPDCGFDYLTGVEVSHTDGLPNDFTSLTLPAGRYAVFPHTEHVSSLGNALDRIWTQWAPSCGLSIAKSPCFERYTSDFNPQTGMGGTEIWIPLEV